MGFYKYLNDFTKLEEMTNEIIKNLSQDELTNAGKLLLELKSEYTKFNLKLKIHTKPIYKDLHKNMALMEAKIDDIDADLLDDYQDLLLNKEDDGEHYQEFESRITFPESQIISDTRTISDVAELTNYIKNLDEKFEQWDILNEKI